MPFDPDWRWEEGEPEVPEIQSPSSINGRTPCLLISRSENDRWSGRIRLYSLESEADISVPVALPCSDPCWKTCLNSSNGFLLVMDDFSTLWILNPLQPTTLIPLPPMETFGTDIRPVRANPTCQTITDFKFLWKYTGCRTFPAQQAGIFYLKKAVIGSADASLSDYAVAAICRGQFRRLAFTRKADRTWTIMERICHIEDILYLNGLFLILDNKGKIVSCDLNGRKPKISRALTEPLKLPNWPQHWKSYLVPLHGTVHQIVKAEESVSNLDFKTSHFQVFKLVGRNWIQARDLGGDALFLGLNDPVVLSPPFTSPSVRGNCIYFTDDHMHYRFRDQQPDRLGIFNLEDGSLGTFYPDDYQLLHSRLIWFMPNLSSQHAGREGEEKIHFGEEKGKKKREAECKVDGERRGIKRKGEALSGAIGTDVAQPSSYQI